ncbi:hypothetical protein [Brunnivagina elsteri]|uniref:Uncharacterized protein n=1 Tax=Brunnivagina elsteri CCALA 953 TaxID=987040 RepID=A0A2A2TF02_9CYAN|nr:hypothetical protein [Calothrix elsteri]PAX52208.1 hypothetical protein CK510_20595 [Calothrix elsteri CCALA 953]
MNKIQLFTVFSYVLMTCYFFFNWIRFSQRRPSSSVEDGFLSFVMCCITTIFWPLIIPMSVVEIVQTRRIEYGTAVPVLAVLLALSLSLYLA